MPYCRYSDCKNPDYKRLCKRRYTYIKMLKFINAVWTLGLLIGIFLCIIFGILQFMRAMWTVIVMFMLFYGVLGRIEDVVMVRYNRADALVRKLLEGGLGESNR